MNLVSDFSSTKIVEYLNEEVSSVCILMPYSFQEIMVIYPLICSLRTRFEKCQVDIMVMPEFSALFSSFPLADNEDEIFSFVSNYQIGFDLRRIVPSAELRGESIGFRGDWYSENIFGIPYDKGSYGSIWPYMEYSPFIAVDFTSSVNADLLSVDRATAEKICKLITDAGYMPLEVHFFRNEDSYFPSYSFLECSANDYLMGHLERLTSVLKQCYGYIGVYGDTFLVANHVLCENCLCISVPEYATNQYIPSESQCRVVNRDNDCLTEISYWIDRISDIHSKNDDQVEDGMVERGGKDKFSDSVPPIGMFPRERAVITPGLPVNNKIVKRGSVGEPVTYKLKNKRSREVIYL